MRSLVVFVAAVVAGTATALVLGTVWLTSALVAGLVLSLVFNAFERRTRTDVAVVAERETLLRNHGAPVTLLFSPTGELLHAGDAVTVDLGWDPDDFASLRLREFVHPDDLARLRAAFDAVRDVPAAQATCRARVRSTSAWDPMEAQVTNACDVVALGGYVVCLRPMVEADRAEHLARRRAAALADLDDLLAMALADGDARTVLQAIAARVRHTLEVDAVEIHRRAGDGVELFAGIGPGGIALDGRSPSGGTCPFATEAVQTGRAIAETADAGAVLAEPFDSAVEPGAMVLRWSGHRDLDPAERSFVRATLGLITLVRRQRTAEQRAFRRVREDDVTGLVNRDTFLERVGRAVRLCEGTQGHVGVLLLDLDHFNVVNDSLGHAAGDQLLEAVGHRLAEGLRPGDTLARFGGDEFVVLLPELRDPDQAMHGAQRMQAALRDDFRVAGHDVRVRASIGVATTSGAETAVEPGVLIQRADAALGRAKEDGRERIERFEPTMLEAAVTRLRTEAELRTALAEGQLRIFYQPIVDLAAGTTAGAEALVRWIHPGRGLVTPAEFIPISEETSLIRDIGNWVIDEACAQAAAWRDDGTPTQVSVNIAARHLDDASLLDSIDEALARHDLSPELLAIEMTESTVMSDDSVVAETLRGLRERGVSIAVDDFGTGQSSLASLKKLPVDAVKIDRDFVGAIDRSGDDYAIVSAMIRLAQTLGKTVIAEGVENEQQLELLRDLGCDLAQGFLFSPAVYELQHGSEDWSWPELVIDGRR